MVAVCVTPDPKAEAAWFAAFGFSAPSDDDPWWLGLRAGELSGVLGVHAGEIDDADVGLADDPFRSPYEVRIGFETHLPLTAEADRLRAAGLLPTVITGEPVPRIVLTDPEGEEVQIHPAA